MTTKNVPVAIPRTTKARRAAAIIVLMAAGESIFLLPFALGRIFRPTLLDVFGLTNLQLGAAYSLYGVLALVSYFLGGPLADRFAARRLMTAALVATALGGVLLTSIPPLGVLTLLYGFWGVTTILLFWAALIRATREWGGSASQGRAFGLLEGGRGLLSALLASASVAIFSALLPAATTPTLAQRSAALIEIMWTFIGIVLGAAVLVWFTIPETAPARESGPATKLTLQAMRSVMRMPTIWLQATILMSVYVCTKGMDDFSLYARDAFGYSDVAAAQVAMVAFWVRPFAAMGAGLLADRTKASRTIVLGFCVLIASTLTVASGAVRLGVPWMVAVTIAGTSAGIFAVRGVFFALFQEARVPLAVTGSAVGVVSVLGYTPDIFMAALIGYVLDRAPGALGHQQVFGMMAASATLGLIATLLFQRVTRRAATQ